MGRVGVVLVVAVCIAGVLAAGQDVLAEKFHMHALARVGTEMFAVGRGRTVEIRSWADPGRTVKTLAGAEGIICSIAVSPDERLVAAGDQQGYLMVWEIASGVSVLKKRAHKFSGWVWSVAFSPDGTLLASGAFDARVLLWDTTTWMEVGILVDPRLSNPDQPDRAHVGWVRCVTFSPDSRTVVTSGCDGYVRIWDADTLRLRRDAIYAGDNVYFVAYSPDGTRLAASTKLGTAGEVRVYRADTWEEEMRFQSSGSVYAFAFSPDGRRIFGGGYAKKLHVWDLAQQALVAEYSGPSWESIWGVIVFPDGQRVVTTSGEYATDYIGETWLWRLAR